MKRALVSWSTGKDSAWMLHALKRRDDVALEGLLTTFNVAADRVAMHAVPRRLAERQAEALGLPLVPVMLPWPCTNEDYERLVRQELERAADRGVTHVAFGDLFLTDIRDYRVRLLGQTRVEPLFPIWCGEGGTADLARQMIAAGLRAVVTCVDPRAIDPSFAGRDFDESLLADLPASVDPCGERGEFHTFCYDGPIFSKAIPVLAGDPVERDGFVFADVTEGRRVDG